MFQKKDHQNYLKLHGDFALVPELRIFLMPKTFELRNIPGTVCTSFHFKTINPRYFAIILDNN